MAPKTSATPLLRQVAPGIDTTGVGKAFGFLMEPAARTGFSGTPSDLPSDAPPLADFDSQRAVADKSDRADTDPPPTHYRTIWLSDIHLGSGGCQADYLLDFLRHNESDQLYLVGDIIDGWRLKKGWYWPQAHNDVVQKILRKARKGTQVFYIPGNHDEVARQFCDIAFGEILVRSEAFHTTVTGKKLWIVHGDLFDGVIQHAKWLAYLGDTLYSIILVMNRWFNRIRSRLGFGYWSLSQYLKHQVKNAVNFIASFERVMIDETRRRGCDGVVCGHIHKPEIREIDGLLYCNDGDWVESLSALVETYEGELKIVYWTTMLSPAASTKAAQTSGATV